MAAAGLFVVKALIATAAVGAVSSMMQPDEPPPPPIPPDVHRNQEGRRLSDLKVQYSSYGKVIPLIYGTMRLAGNVIWSRPIAESQINTTDVRAGSAHTSTVYTHHTNYAYTATLAIALCKGPISGLLRVWADSKQIDLSQFNHTLYLGDEEQLPDTTILSFEDHAPAYRGLAYIVIRDFALAEYGNRIPIFTFEIRSSPSNGVRLEDKIKEITFGLGVGEHLYDTTVQERIELVGGQQSGTAVKINQNNLSSKADALVALDNMQQVIPRASWVALPVYWVLNTKDGTIKPAVDSVNHNSRPDEWRVAGYTRSTAHHASNGFSTPSDVSILRTAQELKRRGYRVMLCPRLLQRRGDTFVRSYVTSVQGKQYTNFITHYANLLADHIDAFVIASSKLLGFDGVAYCKDLASTVKSTFGARNIKVVLSASSKHYHARQGIYYMDGIWSDSNIDVIGIEAYFPLGQSNTYEQIQKAWRKGEGWHHEGARYLSKTFAWKNMQYWWESFHVDPDGKRTSWQPRMKPIWITELAFGSVEGCTKDSELFSEPFTTPKGTVDFAAQRIALEASLDYLKSQECIEKVFVRFWDTRPHPFYPLLKDKWQLPYTWEKDCSLQGKLGLMTLGNIVSDLLEQAGFAPEMYDVSDLQEVVQGFSISNRQSIRRSLEQLAAAYFFDCLEADGILKFVKRGSVSKATINAKDCIDQSFVTTRLQELELPKAVNVSYINLAQNYETGTVKAERQTVNALNHTDVNLPLVLSQACAQRIAEVTLLQSWIRRTQYKFSLLPKYMHLKPTDVITMRKYVEHAGKGKRTVGSKQKHLMRIVSTKFAPNGVQEIVAVAENVWSYKYYAETIETVSQVTLPPSSPKTEIFLFSIPDATDKAVLSCAAYSRTEGWRGCNLYANGRTLRPNTDTSNCWYCTKFQHQNFNAIYLGQTHHHRRSARTRRALKHHGSKCTCRRELMSDRQ